MINKLYPSRVVIAYLSSKGWKVTSIRYSSVKLEKDGHTITLIDELMPRGNSNIIDIICDVEKCSVPEFFEHIEAMEIMKCKKYEREIREKLHRLNSTELETILDICERKSAE